MFVVNKIRAIVQTVKNANQNVKITFLFGVLNNVSQGVWFSTALAIWVQSMAGTTAVGWAGGANGIALLLCSLPAAIFIDRPGTGNRRLALRVATVLGIVATLCIAVAVLVDNVVTFFCGLLLFGAFWAVASPCNESIFADSVPTGNRSAIYSAKYALENAAYSVGPLLGMILFSIVGNDWHGWPLKIVMLVGLAFNVPCCISMLFYDESLTLGLSSEGQLRDRSKAKKTSKHVASSGGSAPLLENADADLVVDDTEESEDVLCETWSEDDRPACLQPLFRWATVKRFPYLLGGANFVTGLGAGLSIEYFPLFLSDHYKLSPVGVNFVYFVMMLAVATSAFVAQKVAKKIGRPKTILAVQYTGITLLVTLSFYPPLAVGFFLFIFRTAAMRAASPLSRSILMDLVPKSHRGRWNSLEQIAWGLCGNGSSIVGGYIVDAHGFAVCFVVTAAIYFASTLPTWSMIGVIPVEKDVIIETTKAINDQRVEEMDANEPIPDVSTPASVSTIADTISLALIPDDDRQENFFE